jgi:uncharacterized protein YjcR
MAANLEAAKRDYLSGMKNQEIADKYGVSLNTVKSWIKRHGWKQEKDALETGKGCTLNGQGVHPKKKRGAPPGNKNAVGNKGGAPPGNDNAVGNRGGHGGPPGNKKAVTTGEYETIWFDTLTAEEQQLFGKVNTSPLAQAEESIIFLTFRERRMMERIAKLMKGLTESEKRILSELREEKKVIEMYDEKTASMKTVVVPETKLVVTNITETTIRAIDDILKIEDALTRVQQQKARWVALKHSIENAAKGEGGDIAKEHARRLQEVWANRR